MDPILLPVPMPIITPRLILRPPGPGDGAEQMKAVAESIKELREWMPWAEKEQTLEEAESNVRHARLNFESRQDLRIHAYDRVTGEHIVGSGLHSPDWRVRKFEIGYWVRTSKRKQGYVSEVVNALTRYAFKQLGARRVEIRCDTDNTASINVAKRLGFQQEGRLRNEALKARSTELRDTFVFSRVDLSDLPDLEVSWPEVVVTSGLGS